MSYLLVLVLAVFNVLCINIKGDILCSFSGTTRVDAGFINALMLRKHLSFLILLHCLKHSVLVIVSLRHFSSTPSLL